jgi:GNAT superfamily N-acetyltransferase
MMAAAADIVLRPIRREDHDSWMPLWRGYQQFYKVDIAAAVSATTFERLLDPAEPVNGTLAWQDTRAVGMVHYIQHRSTWTIGNYCYLQDLFTAPELRGGGVGRKLIEHVYEVAKQAGCARVYWLTHESNDTAMKLYDRVADKPGFIQYRRVL